MRFSEGPWWVPGAITIALIGAILAAPTQTGHLVGSVVRGGVAAIDAATGDKTVTLPEPPAEEAGP